MCVALMATVLLPVPVTEINAGECFTVTQDLNKVWERVSERRGQVRNWPGKSLGSQEQLCLSSGPCLD